MVERLNVNNMKGKQLLFFLLNLIVAVVAAYIFSNYNKVEVAYVRSHDLIYSYEGTKEAMVKFEGQKSQWQGNVDTLKLDFQRAISAYNKEYGQLSGEERKTREEMLGNQRQQLEVYAQAIDNKIKEEDSKLMESVLNQVNSFVEGYAKENGYDIILGTTTSGSILYGEERLDVTDEVLEALNGKYRGE